MDTIFTGTIYANEQAVDHYTGHNATLVLTKLMAALDEWGTSTQGVVKGPDGEVIHRCRKSSAG